jgi:hypothetical protein
MARLDDLLEASSVLKLHTSEPSVTVPAERDSIAAVERALRVRSLRVDVMSFQLALRTAVYAAMAVELEHGTLPALQLRSTPWCCSLSRAQANALGRSLQQTCHLQRDERQLRFLVADSGFALEFLLPRSHEREAVA